MIRIRIGDEDVGHLGLHRESCPEVEDFDRSGITQKDYIALLWELKKGGVLQQDEVMFGCLNPECAPYLEKGVVTH